jgi:NADH-quinone oxidoreductase subunit A
MLSDYLPVLILVLVAVALAGAMTLITFLLPSRPNPTKLSPYECGIIPDTEARRRFPIKFYLVAMLFIIFDVEVVSFYPWALLMRQLRMPGFWEMAVFLLIVGVGYLYIVRSGALEWE